MGFDAAGPEDEAAPRALWPESQPGERIIFLIDPASRVERRMLERWISESRPDSVAADRIETHVIPSSRRRRRNRAGPELEAALATSEDPVMAPLRVIWRGPLRGGRRSASLLGLLTIGDPRDPNWLRQAWVRRRSPDRWLIVAGEPAYASNLRQRWTDACGSETGETGGFAEFVTQKATLALERAERRIRGARYKVPRLVREEILGRPAFRGEIARLASESARTGASDESVSTLSSRAHRYLREIAATHSPLVIDLMISIIRWVYSRGYDEKLVYDENQMRGIAALEERHPVVFLPTHKSNLDHLVLQYALHEHGLPPNHTAGGINMNFFPVGQLVRRSGVFFIRRTFRDNAVYKHVLSHYIDYLIEKRFPLEWYIEGGRSRSGKLLPPRFGLLSNVVGAYQRQKSDDVYLVPVSIAYDQIQDLGSYVNEQKGGAKQQEGFSWVVGVLRQLKRRYGQIHIAFGEPLSLREQLGDNAGPPTEAEDPSLDHDNIDIEDRPATKAGRFDLEKLAFEVSVRINQVTPITPISLVTLSLLGATGQAMTISETRQSLSKLIENVRRRNLPTTADFDHLGDDAGVQFTLEALVENDVVTRFDEGLEPVYGIGDDQQLSAAYYRNTIVHFFVSGAIAELAMLHAISGERSDLLKNFWDEVMRLRDILKFEFFFAEKEAFRAEVHDIFELNHRDWERRVKEYELDPQDMIRRTSPFMSHRVLRPFLESYRVAADQLTQVPPDREFDEKRFLKDCLGLGRQYELQKRIHAADSVSKVLFQSAVKLADNRGLLGPGGEELTLARRAFSDELRDAVRRVDIIVAIAASRRAGFAS